MRKRAARAVGSLEADNIIQATVSAPEVSTLIDDIEFDTPMTNDIITKPKPKRVSKKTAVPTIRSADEILESMDEIDIDAKKPSTRKKAASRKAVEKLPDGVEPPKPKRPGRPKKVILKHQVPKQGIIHEPSNAREAGGTNEIYIFEVVYENPLMFKKIFSACKSIDADFVRLRFGAEELSIYAQNDKNTTRVFTRVLGSRLNAYYSGHPGIEIGLKLDAVVGVLGTINNENSKFQINTRQRLQNEKVKIIGSNDQEKQRAEYEIAVQSLPEYDWNVEEEIAQEREYPITFEISFKGFKKLVSDAKSCGAEYVHLEKESDGDLRFSYALADNNGRGDIYLYDNKHIKLRSNMQEGDIFASTVYLDNIKGLSSSLISDTIEISADPDRNLILTSYLDHDITDEKKIVPNTEKAILKFVVDIVRA